MADASSTSPRARDFADRIALVTGAASGIGRGISRHLAERGAAVVCCDLQREAREIGYEDDRGVPTDQLIVESGGKAAFCRCDVKQPSDYETAIAVAEDWDGVFDIVVLNAGVYLGTGSIATEPIEDHDLTMEVNERGVWLGLQTTARHLSKLGRPGRIVCTSSTWGMRGGPGAPAYSASKAAVISLVRTAAIELAPEQINVNAICPGYITTAMGRTEMEDPEARADMEATTPWPRLGFPDDIARAVGFLVSDDAAWITGVALPVDGGFSA